MDNRQALVNILKDMQNNLLVVLQLAKLPGDEPLQERFYRWIKDPFPYHPLPSEDELSTWDSSIQEVVDVVQRFAQVIAEKIEKGQTVDGCQTRLTRLREERLRMENRLRQLKMNGEKEETSQKSLWKSRLDLIEDLKIRLKETDERTISCLRLAKECGEVARKEWETNNQKPLKEQQLHCELLSSQLANLVKENSITENQLKKCCEERKKEIESVTLKMNEDICQRRKEVNDLKREVSTDKKQLEELEKELAVVTIDYDAIIEEQQKQAEDALRQLAEEQLREKAAIKIQRWYRFILFRTMRARRRRKKSKRKTSKEVRRLPVDRNKKTIPDEVRPDSQYERDASGEPVTVLDVLVARKSALLRNRHLVSSDHSDLNIEESHSEFENNKGKAPPKGKSKKSSSAIRSITVKKGANLGDKETKPKPVTSLNRSSQTDNRVPKSKKVF